MSSLSTELTDGLHNLQAIAFDVDGTLTDGTLTWNASDPTSESKSFHFADIMGISLARRLGIHLALISGEPSALVDRFAEKLRIPHVVKGCRDKATALQEWSDLTGVPLANTCFFGDDVNDLWAMEIAGLCACPSDAAEDVITYVSTHPGGFVSQQLGGAGAVREFIDALLKVRQLEGKHVFKLRPPEYGDRSTISSMATTANISLNLPDDILAQARALASSDDLPLDEFVAIAIGRYAQSRQIFDEMLREGQQYGRSIGVTSEEDVERIANGELSIEQLRPAK